MRLLKILNFGVETNPRDQGQGLYVMPGGIKGFYGRATCLTSEEAQSFYLKNTTSI
jgi:hypothetical protein